MPDHSVEIDVLRAASPYRCGAVSLCLIERIVMLAEGGRAQVWCCASKEPYALMVRDAGGVHVIAVAPGAGSLDELCARVAGFDEVLALL